MFDLTTTTILSLVVPTIIAPLACLAFLRVIGRVEATRKTGRVAAAVPAARIMLDPTAAPLAADHLPERNVA
jgi:hypothetical protein